MAVETEETEAAQEAVQEAVAETEAAQEVIEEAEAETGKTEEEPIEEPANLESAMTTIRELSEMLDNLSSSNQQLQIENDLLRETISNYSAE